MALPSLKQLQYLVSLHEHQHFGRAAAACNVTQSTLSAGLKELETVLRTRLVERTRRVTVFTPVGVRVVRRAQDLLLKATELSLLPHISAAPLMGMLRLSIIPTIAPFLLPRILPGIRRTYPSLEFIIHEEMSHEGCAALASGARDCMLLALPYNCGDFEYAALFDDPIVVAMRADEPLAARATVAPSALPDDRLLLLHEGHCLRDHALKACERSDVRSRSVPGASIHTLVQLVSAGMGVALLPQMAVEAGATAGTGVVVRDLDGDDALRTIALAWRRNSPRSEDFALLAEKIGELRLGETVTSPPAILDRCGIAAA
ncbi:MAG: hydrogen peroxide-inducible genes activator [Caulobacteraceae bacterium]